MKTRTAIIWLLLLATVTTGVYYYFSQIRSEAAQNISPGLGGLNPLPGTTPTAPPTPQPAPQPNTPPQPVTPQPVAPQPSTPQPSSTGGSTNTGSSGGILGNCNNLSSCFSEIYNLSLRILPIIVLIILIYAGYLYISSLGSESRVGEAKAWIAAAITGLVILLIIPLLLRLLGVQS